MIGKLKGTIDSIYEDHILVDVHGVCYLAFCSGRTIANIGSVGEAVVLFIETYVREDQLKLFGFANELEREWFNLLQSVQGVGAKVALAILTTLSADEINQAIILQDKAMLARTPGIGPKVALRIVNELKNKLPAANVQLTSMTNNDVSTNIGEFLQNNAVTDAISALTNLGYSRDHAAAAITTALKAAGDNADSSTLIRLGLKELSS